MVKEQHLSHQLNLDWMTMALILLCDANVNLFYILQCSGALVFYLETDPVVWFNPFFHLDETLLSLRRLEAHPLLPPHPPRRPTDSHIVPPVSHSPPKWCTLSGFCCPAPCSFSGRPRGQPAPRPRQMGWEYARPPTDPAGAQESRGWALGGGGAAESPEGRPGGPAAITSRWGALQGGPSLSAGWRGGGRWEEERSSDLHRWRTPRCEPGERRIRLPLWEKEVERQEEDGWRGAARRRTSGNDFNLKEKRT